MQDRIQAALKDLIPADLAEDSCQECAGFTSVGGASGWTAWAAAAVLALFTEEHGYQLEEYAQPDDPDEPHAWFPAGRSTTDRPITHRRWVSTWERVQ